MKKWIFVTFCIPLFTLTGCSNGVFFSSKPPEVFIEVAKEEYDTKLGTYCWGNSCVDTAGPVEMLEGEVPVKVKPGERIKLVMDYKPLPNSIHLLQINEELEEVEVFVEDYGFTAPAQKGIYYYSYGVWWMDEKQENVSNGDAFYAFALEVE
ncbi:hypothetical protein [Cytobacillus massiliigabonensis]|uniref:hypothetical protein n=1 Tax=Cytobacillus massiliigabonensis TaxID=1871011 RepID=UPI0015E10FC6|nr:hypothetical protein [Cytobacillus massiliigabonensis]